MADQGLPNSGYTKRLTIEIMGTFLGMAGMDKFRQAMAEVKRLQNQGVRDAEEAARKADQDATRALRRKEQLAAQELSLTQRLERDKLLASQQFQAGRLDAHARTNLRIQQLEDNRLKVQKQMLEQEVLANQSAATRIAALRAQTIAGRVQGVSAGLGLAGLGVAGVGVGALVGGYELARTGANWQTFMLQQQAKGNFGMPGMAGYVSPTQLDRFVRGYGVQTGADFQQLGAAARFGSDFGFNWSTNQALVRASTMAALPAGGDISAYAQSIGGAMVNFPGENPMDVANMITMAARAGRADPNDFTSAVARLLVMVGQFHNPKLLPQALAAVSALTRAGLPPDVAAMMVYNMLFHIIKTSRSQQTALANFKDAYGVDLSGDFTPNALATKGITGILQDLVHADVGPGALGQMLPDIRGYFGALGLTNNGAGNYQQILGQVQGAPRTNPVGNFFQQYLGTTNAQAAMLTNQLKTLSITLGTDLLPIFNRWMKDYLVPLVKDIDDFTRAQKGTIEQLVRWSPYLIAIGTGLKGISLALGVANGDGALGRVGMFTSKLLGIKPAAEAAKIGMADMESGATAAIGTAGAGGVGSGILGLAAAIGILASAVLQLKAVESLTGSDYSNIGGDVWKLLMSNPITATVLGPNIALLQKLGIPIPGLSSGSSGGSSMAGYATMAGQNTTPKGSWFGSFGNPSNIGYPNENFIGSRQNGVLYKGGPVGSVVDVDFPSNAKEIRLPGGSFASYIYLGSLYDGARGTGAGNVELWATPGIGSIPQGHFAVLHLSRVGNLSRGRSYGGGKVIGTSGHPAATGAGGVNTPSFWHLCVQADAAARAYFAWAETNPNSFGPKGVVYPRGEAPYASTFNAAGKSSHIDPSVLAGVGFAESSGAVGNYQAVKGADGHTYGSMGTRTDLYGRGPTGQIKSAASTLDERRRQIMADPAYYHRHMAAARHVLDRLGVPKNKQGPNQIILVIAIASFLTGYAGLDRYESSGMEYAYKVLAYAESVNHGAFPATWFTGQGPQAGMPVGGTTPTSVPAAAGGATGGLGRGLPSPGQDANQRQWSKYHKLYVEDQRILSQILSDPKYKNADGTVNFSAMPPAVRRAVDALLRKEGFDRYMMALATDNEDIKDPKVRGPLISDAWRQYMSEYSNPEAYFNQTKARSSSVNSNAGRSVPVHIIGHCAAEAKKAKAQEKHAATAHTSLTVQKQMLVELRTIKQQHAELLDYFTHDMHRPHGPQTTSRRTPGGLKVTPRVGH